MREFFGSLLIVGGLAVFITALVAMFRPMPKLRLATRKATAIGMALSVGSCVVGAAVMPPAPPAGTAPAAPAEQSTRAKPETPVTRGVYDEGADQLIAKMNVAWAELDQPGAFAVNESGVSPDRIGGSCLRINAPGGLGIWTTISKAPCEES